LPVYKIGKVGGDSIVIYDDGKKYIDVSISSIRNAWRSFSDMLSDIL